MPRPIPPYFANPDGSQCQQAVLKMILTHFEPEKNWDWELLNEICEYEKGIGTWDIISLYNLAKLGYSFVVYDDFDLAKFAADARGYLTDLYGASYTQHCYDRSNVELAVKYTKLILQEPNLPTTFNQRNYTIDDLKLLLNDRYLLNAWVNNLKLMKVDNDRNNGHFVLIYDVDDDYIYLHNPGGVIDGKPVHQVPSQKVPIDHFFYAATMNNNTGTLTAIKLQDK